MSNQGQLHPRAAKIASELYRFYSAHKTRVTQSLFCKELHTCLSHNEASALFEYYCVEEDCMKQSLTSTRVYSFVCSQEHFNCVAVSEVLKKCGIKEERIERKGISHNIVLKPSEPKVVNKVVEKPVIVQSEPIEKIVYKDRVVYKEKDYNDLSVDELDAKINQLKKLREQKNEENVAKKRIRIDYNLRLAKVTEYCRKLGCQRNELKAVLSKIITIMQDVAKIEKDHPFVKDLV